MESFTTFLNGYFPEGLTTFIVIMIKIVAILLPLILAVAYTTFAERKIIGYMQVRLGPNRVGPKGWLQPIADTLKLMFPYTTFAFSIKVLLSKVQSYHICV